MDLKSYFENTDGIGILSTSNSEGMVDSAIYARPHMLEEARAALIMCDKLSHKNLQSNPRACYLFKEAGEGYKGLRLYLRKLEEDDDQQKVAELRRQYKHYSPPTEEKRFVVYFEIEKVRKLVGD